MDIPNISPTESAPVAVPAVHPDPLPVPPLPAEAALAPSLAAGVAPWLDLYLAYAARVCPMLPPPFHESAALWLTSVAVARRLYVSLSGLTIYPNLFVAWLIPNDPYGAQPAFERLRDLAERAFGGLLAPSHIAPRDLLLLFARCLGNGEGNWRRSYYSNGQDEHFPAQRGWLVDNLSDLLPASRRAFHRAGLDLLVDFYRCQPRYRSAGPGGFLTVADSYLTLFGCASPADVAGSLAERSLWDHGWWSSFAFVLPEPGRPAWQPSALPPEPPELLATLLSLFRELPGTGHPDHYRPLAVQLAPGVAPAWQSYQRALAYDLLTPELDARLWNAYCHLPLQLIKVASLLAALDWVAALPPDPPPPPRTLAAFLQRQFKPDEVPVPAKPPVAPPTLTLAHLARAQVIVEGWRANLHRALAAGCAAASGDLDTRILRQIEMHEPAGATPRDVYRGLGDRKPKEISARLAELVALGLVETIPGPDLPGPGGPTVYYRVAR